MNITLSFFILATVWLVGLTVFLVWLYLRLKNLFLNAKDGDFLKAIKKIENLQEASLSDIKDIKRDILSFKEISLNDFSKIGVVKFNPFNDTGGGNSFSMALLDGNKNGIIVTSLHSRERTRLYLKEIKSGKSTVELSKDEEKALAKALK